jgi:rhomboid family GlyGly-CTERM serine protease
MAQEKKGLMTSRFPLIILAFLGPSLAIAASPTITSLLIYDRVAVEQGEIWRLFTCQFVHYSPSHLFWNLAVTVAVASLLEMERHIRWRAPVAASLLLIGPALHILEPGMQLFCGLSGPATTMTVCLCLSRFQNATEAKWVWATTLALLAGKVFIEFRVRSPLFATAKTIEFQVVPLAHLIGGAIGFFCLAGRRSLTASRSSPKAAEDSRCPRPVGPRMN